MNNYNDSFLNLLKYPLDKYQQAALKTERNSVIAAGAGSGKTQVLATRFAWLVMTKQAKADEILTLTFTNKAAAEMYQRIYETLYKYANSPVSENLTAEHKQLAKQALEDFANVHIQTLDSYCSAIVRQCANRYGIKPDFATGSADGERNIKDKALVFLIQNMDNLAVKTYCQPGQIQTFAEDIFAQIIIKCTSLATEDGYFKKMLKVQCQEIADSWNNLIIGKATGSISSYIDDIYSTYMASSKKDDPAKKEYCILLDKLIDGINLLTDITPLTLNDFETNKDFIQKCIEAYNKFTELVFTTQNAKGKISEISTHVTPLKNALPYYDSIISFILQYESIKAFNLLLDQFLNQINTAKRTSGNLTFGDVSELALKVLLENEDIRNQEKNAYKKIMIDEFQDNNGKNRDLLYLLSIKNGEFEDKGNYKITIPENKSLHDLIVVKDENGNITEDKRDENKLFFVGDEKQSIYKFRGADVSIFNELTSGGENQLIPMTNNYRSDAELLSGFNMIFKNGHGIFESYVNEECKIDYEAYYEKDAEKKDTVLPEITKENSRIHVAALNEEDYETAPDSESELLPKKDQLSLFIAQEIRKLAGSQKNWSDFAILTKSRTNYSTITKYLSKFGIPYQVDSQKNLFAEAVVNDFYNFLRICVYPSDINAYSAYLCSPFVGLNANTATKILSHLLCAKQETPEFTFDPFADFDDAIKVDLKSNEFEKYINGRNFFKENKDKVLQQKLTTTLSYLWNNKGYKYETMLSEESQLCAEHFDMLFELARQAEENDKTVSWFIDQLDLLRNTFAASSSDIEGDVSYPLERQSAVRIMTIHKSKGLEFKHVFLYECFGNKSKSEKDLYFYDEQYGVSIKPEIGTPNYFVTRQKDKAKNMELAEFRRLIYVGITRAINQIYIIGNYKIPKKPSTNILNLFENMVQKYYPKDDHGNYPFNTDAGFDYIPIKPVDYETLYKLTVSTQSADDKLSSDQLRNKVLNTVKDIYPKASEIVYECNPIPRSTPSSLEPSFVESQAEDGDSGQLYDSETDTLQNRKFSAADFGTLVHSYLEMQANGIAPEDYEPAPKLLKNLEEKDIAEKKATCVQMCKEFSQSAAGIALEQAKTEGRFYRAEWAFRMFYEGTIFTGSIDLIFQNVDGTYSIIDYKSDNQIMPEKYIEQQKCYKIAASKMLKVAPEKITTSLYFLKHKEIVKI